MNTIKFNNSGARMVAHRGVSGIETENTCAAFVAAGNRSYYGIETDVRVTKDKKFILCHDDTLARTAGVDIGVEENNFDELRKITLFDKDDTKGRADLRLASLEEYISICKKYEKHCFLEIKGSKEREIWEKDDVYRLVDLIDGMGYLKNVTFIAFGFENLAFVKEKNPSLDCMFLCTNELDARFDDMKRLRIGADMGDWWRFNHSDDAIKMLHGEGLEINCWTIDDPERAEKYSSWGVDYITTNILE